MLFLTFIKVTECVMVIQPMCRFHNKVLPAVVDTCLLP